MRQLITTIFVLILTIYQLKAQSTQTVRGTVKDLQSEIPLIGATIQLMDTEKNMGTTTDENGYFVLENVPIGRQAFSVSYLGYESVTLPNVLINTGKEVVLDILLQESLNELEEVVVVGKVDKDVAKNELATISARQFNLEEVNRYSGGRNDVARLVSNFAGVSTADDSRNDIVIRGNSPTGVLWRIEGIPVPNPNHFSTLGTTGGPVSALNPNLLSNSDFLTGAFPAEYGNALGGVFDIGFRNGNADQSEFTLQASAFSGFEALAEGPVFKNTRGSYLVGVRYSLVSIFGAAGTGALPNYSDISFRINSGNTKAGQFTLFGIGGTSDIDFLHDETDEDDLFANPDEDAFAESRVGVLGLKHNLIIGKSAYLRTIIAGSFASNDFNQDRYFNLDTPEEFTAPYAAFENQESRLSFSTFLNKKFSAKATARIGLLVESFNYDLLGKDAEMGPDSNDDGVRELETLYEFDEGTSLIQPFVQTQVRLNEAWTLNLGLHAQYLTLNESFVVEPRAAINWAFAPRQKLSLGYGLHSQNQPLPIQLATSFDENGRPVRTNEDLDFTQSNHFVLGYDYRFAPDWRLKIEGYFQDISNVPVDSFSSSFSLLNIGDDFGFPTGTFNLQNEGTGSNMGVELTIEKFFSKGYYGLLTASLYESNYKGSDGVERSTAFNNTYVLNILAGREWRIGQQKKNLFSVDTKLTSAGGRRYTPIDLAASNEAGFEVEFEELAFSERYDPYFRWDVKLGIQLNSLKKKVSHRFYLDLQNVLNTENVFVRRYNRQTNVVNEVNQIGFFPDFLYRLQF